MSFAAFAYIFDSFLQMLLFFGSGLRILCYGKPERRMIKYKQDFKKGGTKNGIPYTCRLDKAGA